MPRLLIEVPSVDTRDYEVGENINITQPGSRSRQYVASVVARDDEIVQRGYGQGRGQENEPPGSLGPIRSRGDYVRRVVVDLRSTSRSKLRRLTGMRVQNDEGYTVRSDVVKMYDVKEPE